MSRPSLLSAAVAALAVAFATPAWSQTAIKLYAADTLQPALGDLAAEFKKFTGGKFTIEPVVGGSDALRERIEKGEAAHVFVASDGESARKLAAAGRSRGPAVPFAKAGGKEHVFIVLKDAPPAAGELAGFLRYGPGQTVLKKHGFGVP